MSILLLCLSSAFYALNYHSLITQFNAQRESEVRSLRHHIRGLFTGTSDRLIRLGGALASMSNLGEALASKDQDKISTLIADYASLRYELDVRQLDLYTTETDYDLVKSWIRGDEELPDYYLRNAMEKVKEGEKPFTLLYCQPLCLLHAFVPILADGKNVGVISLGQSIADFIIDFHLITGADIALAVPADTNGGGEISGWGMRVPALTDPPKLTALLKHISEIYHNPLELGDGLLIEWKNSHYDVHHVPLDKIIPGQEGFIILISDVSKRLHDIQHALNQAMLATIGGLVAAELILLYLIRVPLRRLGRFALTLPLLAEGAYDQARDRFSAHR
ncbi:MAG: cache domain-containing protein, partial [Methylobacter sp.]